MALPKPFPISEGSLMDKKYGNPAIRLFGNRFIVEQGPLELMAELLAVVFCEKRVGGEVLSEGELLPSLETLARWPSGKPLEYHPPIKLNLKLFALLTASRIDTREVMHVEQYQRLSRRLKGRIRTVDQTQEEAEEAIQLLQDLLQGFQGAGLNRTWCAQTFFPISPALITGETLWNETAAKKEARVLRWIETLERLRTFFSVSKHRFLARGGELLYLQICNALRNGENVRRFAGELRGLVPSALSDEEADPATLHASVARGLSGLRLPGLAPFNRLVEMIEGLDPETSQVVRRSGGEDWEQCEWCPAESWPEGYLFAVELSRLLNAALDPVERLELISMGCALQVLRSLGAQSARALGGQPITGSPLGFAWIFTDVDKATRPLRVASHQNLQRVQQLIYQALRIEELARNAAAWGKQNIYKEADTRYGHKLFLSMGKTLGIIVPRRGPWARFVMTDRLLRYLVLSVLRPGESCTYDVFLQRLFIHHGIAVEGDILERAAIWSNLPSGSHLAHSNDRWLAESLKAGGFLVQLSDAHSVVKNDYVVGASGERG